jgi:hypothetical protein
VEASNLTEFRNICKVVKDNAVCSTYLSKVYLDGAATRVDVGSIQRLLGSLCRVYAVKRGVQLRSIPHHSHTEYSGKIVIESVISNHFNALLQ